MGIVSFKGISAAMLNPPEEGGKGKDRKKPEELKQVRLCRHRVFLPDDLGHTGGLGAGQS
jgi:hypothetical protein